MARWECQWDWGERENRKISPRNSSDDTQGSIDNPTDTQNTHETQELPEETHEEP